MMQRRGPVEGMHEDDHWTQVATTSSQLEAEMLRDLLVGEGIASLVQTNDAGAFLGVISSCRLMVRRVDLDRAAAFLNAWESAVPEADDAAAGLNQQGE